MVAELFESVDNHTLIGLSKKHSFMTNIMFAFLFYITCIALVLHFLFTAC